LITIPQGVRSPAEKAAPVLEVMIQGLR